METRDSWEEVNNRLIRTYYFKEDENIVAFVNKVMTIASKQNHHPDIIIRNDSVKLSVADKEKGKVTEKCHKLALSIDKLV